MSALGVPAAFTRPIPLTLALGVVAFAVFAAVLLGRTMQVPSPLAEEFRPAEQHEVRAVVEVVRANLSGSETTERTLLTAEIVRLLDGTHPDFVPGRLVTIPALGDPLETLEGTLDEAVGATYLATLRFQDEVGGRRFDEVHLRRVPAGVVFGLDGPDDES